MANTALLKPTTVEAVVDEQNPNLATITLERLNAATATRWATPCAASCSPPWWAMRRPK